ncbi:hypothetical protein TREMEDRAFT_64196 [Tremella mesenterica DSM 1558]|uniref:uncharacterized protein n=1 Tax=Tremella mesenterica (strain ATCC 24925 / CBS 8224 / DSM 1558 / NBRC 9311 / NRRL Y-6157 / RJB 2259-6 / UBC 559-6) TaxID=578456 RepID=UPI0003F48E1B|nr:uncharacterized protein TREMEDRAFT_64196 [Tremella mesenterica DSM 1558]EIW67604.1 hypothetical protein TREMEDRAFT_64196 [Tremella mesenterica DSM 1558]
MAVTARRVSYILPSPSEPPPLLSLPPIGEPRKGRTAPLLRPKDASSATTPTFQSRNPFLTPSQSSHPRHCLGVTALALDTSTLLANHTSPQGILYTGGRDGLVASWELGIHHKRRKGGRYDLPPGGNRVKWEKIGDSAELWVGDAEEDEFEDSEEEASSEDEELEGWVGVNGKKAREVPYEERWEVDRDHLAANKPPPTKFRQSAQTHTDWVSAMLLCNLNQTVITASSDRTIRAWSPHSPTESGSPSLVGRHRDYVRTLAWASQPGLLFSGALDRTVGIWDVGKGQVDAPVLSIDLTKLDEFEGIGADGDRGSVYALGVDPAGSVLAAGTPERVVRLWDPRAGDQSIGKLVGHSDCVRSIVMLTGSSDTTIKLWSLAAHRCLHTFNHHTSSVWSLHSAHPNLERFYSGSRDGHLCVVDLERCTDISDCECVVLAREGDTPLLGHHESKSGDEGIRAIAAMDDEFVWTSTGSATVKRWRDVGRRVSRLQYDGVSHHPFEDPTRIPPSLNAGLNLLPPTPVSNPPEGAIRNKRLSLDGTGEGQSLLFRTESRESRTVAFAPTPSSRNGPVDGRSSPSRNTDSPVPIKDRPVVPPNRITVSGASVANSIMSDVSVDNDTDTLNGIPYKSLVCLGLPDSPYSFGFSQHPAKSGVSLLSGHHRDRHEQEEGSPYHQSAQLEVYPSKARIEFEDREVASEAIPLRSTPDGIISGRPGLIRSLLLNDRQHVLSIDTEGEVACWNIIRGVCVGRFAATDVAEAFDLERGVKADRKHSQDVLEMVKQRVEGSLVVHLEEGRVFDAEVYLDELGMGDVDGAKEDTRLNLGKWTLANLFRGLIIAEEREIRASNSTPSTNPPSITRSPAPTYISIERPTSPTPHRGRAMSSSYIPGTPSLNIPGLTTPAVTAAILPESEVTLSTSAPAGWSSFSNAMRGPLTAIPQSPALNLNQNQSQNQNQNQNSQTTSNHQNIQTSQNVLQNQTPSEGLRGDYFSITRRSDPSPNRTEEKPSTPSPLIPTFQPLANEKSTGDKDKSSTVDKTSSGESGKKLMGKLKGFGRKKTEPIIPTTTIEETSDINQQDDQPKMDERQYNQLNILDQIRSLPFSPPSSLEAPLIDFPLETQLLISEESKDAGAWVVTYRSRVCNTEKDLEMLEMNSPGWLLDYLFTGRIKLKEPVKLTFILEPVKDGGVGEMPEGTKRLSASRVLRARKILSFIYDKLEIGSRDRSSSIVSLNSRIIPQPRKSSITSLPPFSNPTTRTNHDEEFSSTGVGPEDILELLCGDEKVDPKMTLATLKHYYGQGGDMVLHYRLKR